LRANAIGALFARKRAPTGPREREGAPSCPMPAEAGLLASRDEGVAPTGVGSPGGAAASDPLGAPLRANVARGPVRPQAGSYRAERAGRSPFMPDACGSGLARESRRASLPRARGEASDKRGGFASCSSELARDGSRPGKPDRAHGHGAWAGVRSRFYREQAPHGPCPVPVDVIQTPAGRWRTCASGPLAPTRCRPSTGGVRARVPAGPNPTRRPWPATHPRREAAGRPGRSRALPAQEHAGVPACLSRRRR
jgi:hypothetical protein